MKKTITDTQTAFYTKNGWIEFEIPHTMPPLTSQRDPWREDEMLKSFLVKTIGPICLTLAGKLQLRLAFSQWITQENRPKKAGLLKEMISIQNGYVAVSMASHPIIPQKRSPLGILPLPTTADQILFFKPQLILDWPHVQCGFFLTLFSLHNAVYIHNPQDPETNYLKDLGYEFGDQLKAETHPLLFAK